MRIDIELFPGGEGSGALLTAIAFGFDISVYRHPRAGQSEKGPTHELCLSSGGVAVTDIALWKKTSQSGADYFSGALLKGGPWWISVNYLDTDAPSGAVAKLTIRHSPPKQDAGAAAGGDNDFGGRF